MCLMVLFKSLLFLVEKVENRTADVEANHSQAPETKPVSNGQSSARGLDSEHDYTMIGGSSPTKDRWVTL